MHAIEHLLLNFCVDELSADERETRRLRVRQQQRQQAPAVPDIAHSWMAQ
jgi:hypothetical protein